MLAACCVWQVCLLARHRTGPSHAAAWPAEAGADLLHWAHLLVKRLAGALGHARCDNADRYAHVRGTRDLRQAGTPSSSSGMEAEASGSAPSQRFMLVIPLQVECSSRVRTPQWQFLLERGRMRVRAALPRNGRRGGRAARRPRGARCTLETLTLAETISACTPGLRTRHKCRCATTAMADGSAHTALSERRMDRRRGASARGRASARAAPAGGGAAMMMRPAEAQAAAEAALGPLLLSWRTQQPS
jgi:hypothetical protein